LRGRWVQVREVLARQRSIQGLKASRGRQVACQQHVLPNALPLWLYYTQGLSHFHVA